MERTLILDVLLRLLRSFRLVRHLHLGVLRGPEVDGEVDELGVLGDQLPQLALLLILCGLLLQIKVTGFSAEGLGYLYCERALYTRHLYFKPTSCLEVDLDTGA